MADSGALRVRRARAHKAGDHSLCRRCPAVRGEPEAPEGLVSLPSLPDGPAFDTAAELRQLAQNLAAAYGADTSNALLARELRMTLRELIGIEGSGSFDDLAAEYGPA